MSSHEWLPDEEGWLNDLPPVLAAAHRTFALYGVRRATLEDIAQQAGVSRSTVYRGYGSKVQIQAELAAARNVQTFARIREVVPAGTPVAEALGRAIVIVHEAVFGNAVAMRLLEHEPASLLAAIQEPADGSSPPYIVVGQVLGELLRERCPDVGRLRLSPEATAELTIRMQLSALFAPTTKLPEPFEVVKLVVEGLVGPEHEHDDRQGPG